jgi:predicted AlkP superfamily pyrophosphatase or phosphodiesterase
VKILPMLRTFLRLALPVMMAATLPAFAAGKARHVVVVVWDGLRPDFISQAHTPTLDEGNGSATKRE